MKMDRYLKTPLPAIFNGVQRFPKGSFELWTILEPIPDHPQYSTLSRRTIERAGYEPIEQRRASCAPIAPDRT